MTMDEDEEKQFWEGWLDKNLGEYMEKVRTAVRKLYEDNRQQHGDLPYYTPHGPEHCQAVENLLHRLIPGKNFNELKKKERFYLLASAWLHDIGMLRSVAQAVYKIEGMSENEIRKRHHITAAKYIADSWYNCGLEEIDKTILGKLCRYHRKQENINKCEKEHLVGTEKFKLRLLAAYLRLADALDVGPSRTPSEAYAICLSYDIPADAKLHWLKSKLVNGIDIDPKHHDISIEFRIPFADDLLGSIDPGWTDEKINSIIALVCEDIREELSSVMNIITRDGPTHYLDVKERRANVNLDSQLLNDLRELITNYDIMIHPSASRLLEMILVTVSNISGYYLQKNESPVEIMAAKREYNEITKRIDKFLNTAKDQILSNRPSHLGLKSLISTCGKINEEHKNDDNPKQLIKEINDIYQAHHLSKKKIREQSRLFFGKIYGESKRKSVNLNILLFGYSELATKAICGFRDYLIGRNCKYSASQFYGSNIEAELSKKIRIFICEGQPKTQTALGDRLMYHDGSQYALYLKRRGFNNIILIPDIIAGNIIETIPIDFVLVGADGITSDYFIHSAGHGSLVNLVREHRKRRNGTDRVQSKIVLVTSREKWSPALKGQRDGGSQPQDVKREIEGCWFWRGLKNVNTREHVWISRDAALLDTLYDEGIMFFNPREDMIPIEHIDYIITDKTWKPITRKNANTVIDNLFKDETLDEFQP